jgi:hypothetical protein
VLAEVVDDPGEEVGLVGDGGRQGDLLGRAVLGLDLEDLVVRLGLGGRGVDELDGALGLVEGLE